MHAEFIADATAQAGAFPHFWEHTIGSGHATLALRSDWQQQMKRCHHELGFSYARFHGILSDDMGTLLCEQNKLLYSFFNANQVTDFLESIGMHPFVELSFMPAALSSGGDTVFKYQANVTPPKNYADWELLIQKLVQNWVKRYGLPVVREWFFEVWNEPNLDSFWKGSQADYFTLYQHTASAIKAIDDKLKVGGPATAKNEWIIPFREFCEKNKVPCDFISTHHYPTDAFGQPGDDTITQLAKSRRSVLREETQKARREAGDTALYYTEWCTSSNPFDELHDLPYAAAFIIKTIVEASGYVSGYSYWTFSDIFEENYLSSVPFHGGFGLLNIYGIPKPAYRAFEMLHRLGNWILPVKGTHDTVDAWLFKNNNGFHLLLTNFALPRHPVQATSVSFTLQHPGAVKNIFVERIDEAHANARQAWEQMGSPGILSQQQVQQLEEVSALQRIPLAFEQQESACHVQVEMPVCGSALITIEV